MSRGCIVTLSQFLGVAVSDVVIVSSAAATLSLLSPLLCLTGHWLWPGSRIIAIRFLKIKRDVGFKTNGIIAKYTFSLVVI